MSDADLLSKVRRALGRSGPLPTPPVPPAISEPITRLVHTDLGLPELFAKVAKDNKMQVEMVYVQELAPKLIEFFKANGCSRIALPASAFLDKLNVFDTLRQAGFQAKRWPDMTLDEIYDYDAGLTDVFAAVAETGSLVIRPTPEHGRAISLVPPIHVAILQPKDFVPDLLDLMERLAKEPGSSGTVIITGPSKTADIEMQLVQGVHGPGLVQLFILA